jgi:hypothetical protein
MAEAGMTSPVTVHSHTSEDFLFRKIRYKNMECLYGKAAKGGKVSRPAIHGDDFEICWVLSGKLLLTLPTEKHILKKDESLPKIRLVNPKGDMDILDCNNDLEIKFEGIKENNLAMDVSSYKIELINSDKNDSEYSFTSSSYDESDGLYKALLLIFNGALSVTCIKVIFSFMKAGMYGFSAIIFFLFLLSTGAFVFGIWVIVKTRTHVEKPIGVTFGYLIGSSMCTQERHGSYDPYIYTVEHNSFSDIWIEKEDKFLYKIPQTLYAFKYAGGEYRWSELAYTPVKVLVFPGRRIEVMPAFKDNKK